MSEPRILGVVSSNGGARNADVSYSPNELARLMKADPDYVVETTATIEPSWHGKIKRFAQGCTVTIPAGLPLHFSCGWRQEGEDPVEFVAGEGVTIQSMGDAVESAGQFAIGGLVFFEQDVASLYGALA